MNARRSNAPRLLAAATILTLAASGLAIRAGVPAVAASAPQDAAARDDQGDLAVTVYNSSLALIRDIREFALPAGESDLQFIDIAATVNPATVHFRSLTDPARVSVLE
jgi:hypothetical protein